MAVFGLIKSKKDKSVEQEDDVRAAAATEAMLDVDPSLQEDYNVAAERRGSDWDRVRRMVRWDLKNADSRLLDSPKKIEDYINERYGPELRGEVPQEELAPDHPLTAKYGSWTAETLDWDSARIPSHPGSTYEGQITGSRYKEEDEVSSHHRGLTMHGLGVFTFGDEWDKLDHSLWAKVAPARIGAYRGYQLPKGSRYEGEFRNGAAHGYGVVKIPDEFGLVKLIWGGQWIEGMRHGCGISIDFSGHNRAIHRNATSVNDAKELIKDRYGLWKLDSFHSDAVFPWEFEPQLVVGQHFGKHEDMFDQDGLPKFDSTMMSSFLEEQEGNYHKRVQMQSDEFSKYISKSSKYHYCKTGDAWASFTNATKVAKMARMFENKPDGIVNLQNSFGEDPDTGETVFIRRDSHPLFYRMGTQCLMPGPMGQLFSIPDEFKRKMMSWANWHDKIHSAQNYDPQNPPYPKAWEKHFTENLIGVMKLLQTVRDERSKGMTDLKEKFRKKIEEDDIKSEDELKIMRWVLKFPEPEKYPQTKDEMDRFGETPIMKKKWLSRIRNRTIGLMPPKYRDDNKRHEENDDDLEEGEIVDGFDNNSILELRKQKLAAGGLRIKEPPPDTGVDGMGKDLSGKKRKPPSSSRPSTKKRADEKKEDPKAGVDSVKKAKSGTEKGSEATRKKRKKKLKRRKKSGLQSTGSISFAVSNIISAVSSILMTRKNALHSSTKSKVPSKATFRPTTVHVSRDKKLGFNCFSTNLMLSASSILHHGKSQR